MFGGELDIYDNFTQLEPKLKEILTAHEFSLLNKSAKQNLNQIKRYQSQHIL